MTLNRDAAFRLKVNVDGANQISAFSRNLKGLETTASLSKAQLGQMNIQINRMAREAGNTTAGIRQHIAALTTLRDRVDLNSNAYKRLGVEIDQLQAKLKRATGAAAAPTAAGGGDLLGGLGALRGRIAAITAVAVGIGLAAKSITDVGVASVESQRRLNLLSRGFDDFNRVQDAASAAATKFGLTQTEANQQFAQIYARLRPVGLSLQEVTAVYNGFNTAAKLSGTNSQEAAGAFLQLSQALGSGVLRGQELNSVFEQTPVIVQAIAKEMGVAIGEIRDLAKEGKITSDIVLRALQTIERDGADKLAEAMKGPAQQFKNLQIEVTNLKEAIAELALPVIIDLIRELGDRTANITRFVNDFGDAWKYVNTQIAFVRPGLENLQKFLDIVPTFAVAKQGNQLPGRIAGFVQGLARRQRQAEKDAFIGPPAPEYFGPGGGPTTTPTPDRAQPDLEKDKTKIKEITQIQLDAGLKLLAAKQTGNELLIAELQYEASLADLDQQKMGRRARELAEAELANNLLLSQLNYAEEVGKAVAQDFLKRQQLQENYNRIVEELQIKAGEITGEELKQVEMKQQYEAILKRLPGATDEMKEKIKELVEATQEQGKTFTESFQDKIDEYKESLADFGGEAAGAVINAFQGMEDALTKFVMTGKANFTDFANSVIADITRIIIRQAIIKPLVGALFPGLPFAKGGVFAQNGIVPFAKGGIVDRPMVFPFAKGIGLMGEAGPEAIMPLKRGPGGRLGVEASGGVGDVIVNVDATGTNVEGDAEQQKALGAVIGAAVQAELVKQKKPGGLLY